MAGDDPVSSVRGAGAGGLIAFPIGDTGQTLVFTDQVLLHFDRRQQLSPGSREAGGQLFARLDGYTIRVERATGPQRSDRRRLALFIPDRLAERREIRRQFKDDLHYVGDWHTHRELYPCPSLVDIDSFGEMFLKSRIGKRGVIEWDFLGGETEMERAVDLHALAKTAKKFIEEPHAFSFAASIVSFSHSRSVQIESVGHRH